MDTDKYLIMACGVLALNTFLVGIRLYQIRVVEMKKKRVHPETISLSSERTEKLHDTRASDNYNNLFELPVLFYTLCILALATKHTPVWLIMSAWLFVLLRLLHSFIQCTYNKVMHRFFVFLAGFVLLAAMWIAFLVSYVTA